MPNKLRFSEHHKQIVTVAVNFDDHAKNLIRTAASLCQKTNSKLRIVHACQVYMYYAPFSAGYLPVDQLKDIIDAEAFRKAESDLRELAELVKGGVPVETKVLNGQAEVIIADAAANNSAILVVGSPGRLKKYIPSSFSTTLTIMGNSSVPVLAVPTGDEVDFMVKNFNILACDDLSNHDQTVADSAVNLAVALRANLIHLHINGLEKDQLQAAISLAAASGYSSVDLSTSTDDVFAGYKEALEKRMSERVKRDVTEIEKVGGLYSKRVLYGQVENQLNNFLEAVGKKINLIVFGRHQTIHKPFAFGRMPFRTMIAKNCPILIVPPSN